MASKLAYVINVFLVSGVLGGAYYLGADSDMEVDSGGESYAYTNKKATNKERETEDTSWLSKEENQSDNDIQDLMIDELTARVQQEQLAMENNTLLYENERVGNWKYEMVSDIMNGSVYVISNKSKNIQLLNGAVQSPLYLKLKERANSTKDFPDYNVEFSLNKGAVVYCHNTCAVKVRFDDKVHNYNFKLGAAGVTNVLYIDSRGHFLQELKGASEVAIEIPVYGIGNVPYAFDVNGLEIN